MEMKGDAARRRKRSASTMEKEDAPAEPRSTPLTKKNSAPAAKPMPKVSEEDTSKPVADTTEEPEAPKVIMSRAQRRRLKKPPVVVTAAMKEEAREEKRQLRKYLRMIKSNGSRRKLAKFMAKREREESGNEEELNAFDADYRVIRRGRRLE